MRFELATAGRIVFGPGAVSDLPAIARTFGTRAFVPYEADYVFYRTRGRGETD